MPAPLARPAVVKKRTAKFKRHQSDRFDRVGVSVQDGVNGAYGLHNSILN